MTTNYSYITHCADSDITFMDLSVSFNGLITDWVWNFGDGGTSTDQNATHNYAQGGFYNVVLSTTNDKGCQDFMVQQIDRKSTRLNSSHVVISYAVFCLKKKNNINIQMVNCKT